MDDRVNETQTLEWTELPIPDSEIAKAIAGEPFTVPMRLTITQQDGKKATLDYTNGLLVHEENSDGLR